MSHKPASALGLPNALINLCLKEWHSACTQHNMQRSLQATAQRKMFKLELFPVKKAVSYVSYNPLQSASMPLRSSPAPASDATN